ncbi:hypothetical protein N9B23_00130 [bacterium]|nr:hypothetical protein [bacterium]
MDEDLTPCVPKKFWVVACLALIWNLMGCVIFYGEMFQQEAMISGFEPDQQAWVRGTPGWIYVIFCISVMTGVVGSVLLLLKSKVCIPLFGISFITVLVQMTFTMVIAGGIDVMGPSAAIMPTIVTLLAAAWLGFSVQALRKGWL